MVPYSLSKVRGYDCSDGDNETCGGGLPDADNSSYQATFSPLPQLMTRYALSYDYVVEDFEARSYMLWVLYKPSKH